MKTAWGVLLALGSMTVASAQERLAGVFSDGDTQVSAVVVEGAFEAALRRGDELFYAAGRADAGGVVRGRFGPAGLPQTEELTATLDGDALLLTTGATTVRLERTSPQVDAQGAREVLALSRLVHPALDALLGRLRAAQARFLEREGSYGALDELLAAGCLDRQALAQALFTSGYVVDVHPSPRTPARAWLCTAAPDRPGRPWFVMNHEGVIHLAAAGPLPIDYIACAIPEGAERALDLAAPPVEVEATGPKTGRPDLSHVVAGQKYTYEMNQGGMKMQMVWEVLELTPAAVKCTITTLMDMGQGLAPVGDATPFEYPIAEDALVTPFGGGVQGVTFENVQAGGRGWRCMVMTSGTTKTWIYAPNDVPTFPGMIRTETDGQATMVLDRVDTPGR